MYTEVKHPILRNLGIYYTSYGSDDDLLMGIQTVVFKYRLLGIKTDLQLHRCALELDAEIDSLGLIHLHFVSRLMAYYVAMNLPCLEKFEKNHQLVNEKNLLPANFKNEYDFYYSMWQKWENLNFDFIEHYIDLHIKPQKDINDYDKSKLTVNDLVANSISTWFTSFERTQQYGILKQLVKAEYLSKIFFKEGLSALHILERKDTVEAQLADVTAKIELNKMAKKLKLNVKPSNGKINQVLDLLNNTSAIESEFSYRLNNSFSNSIPAQSLMSELQQAQKLFTADPMYIRRFTQNFLYQVSRLEGMESLSAANLSWFLYHLLLISHDDVLTGLSQLKQKSKFKTPRDLKKFMKDEIEGKFKVKIKKSGVEIFVKNENTSPQ